MSRGEKIARKVAPEIAERAFNPPAKHNELLWTKALLSQVGAAMSVRLMEKTRVAASKELAQRHGENVKRINGWAAEHYSNFQNEFNAAIRRAEDSGQPVDMMEIARRGIAKGDYPSPNKKIRNRARLIARDQMGKFSGALDRTRAAKLGGEYYQWRSVQDQRVRKDHEEWNGKYFRRDGRQVNADGSLYTESDRRDPEIKEAPKDGVRCRCSAAWVLSP